MAERLSKTRSEATSGVAESDFNSLLSREFKPKTERAREAVESAVKTLAQQALMTSVTVSDDAYKNIESIIGEIDRKLSEQINLILHHEEFQKLESAWRGLHHLVTNTETDEKLKIRFMDVSKDDLRRTMKRYKGIAWDQSPFFKQVYEEEYGQLGGEPYGCLVADYYFDHTPPDVDLLASIAKIASAAHAPFIAGAAPSVLQMDSWQELANPRDLTKIFTQNLEYAPWNSLRNSEDARYIGLAMPRFLSRLPYGAKTNPVDEFDFEEATDGADHRRYVWSNAAYAMAVNINRSFKLYGWCTLIRGVESGGVVENLPCHTFPTDDGGIDMKCPTEIAISDRREAELAKNGFIPLIHRKNTDYAAFIGAQSLQRPAEYYDADATANANLSARLPYLFACSRFAHYLKCIVRDKIGSFKERDEMQAWLNEWIMHYVDADSANSTQETKARRPLAAAEVVVEDVEGNPGYQLLLEYFTFPEKFMFVDLLGLDMQSIPASATSIDVEIVLDRPYPDDMRFSADNIRLYCTPVINLFTTGADPVKVTQHETEYRVRARAAHGSLVDIYSVDSVEYFERGQRFEYVPFAAFRHRGGMLRHETPERYYHTRMRRGPSGRFDTWIVLGGHAWEQANALLAESLSLSVTGTNGILPRKVLREAGITRMRGGFTNVRAVRNLTAPTPPVYPPTGDRFQWRVLSHLAPNYLSLLDAEILRGSLALYDWTEGELNRRRIEAITDVSHRSLRKLVKGGLMRGVEITVTLDVGRFAGDGDLELFGSMLNRFLGLYATLNLYTKLVIVTQPTGRRIEWPETKSEGAPF